VDVRGNLMGINTAILSHGSGGNEGIGFAIPVNMARNVMDQVLAHGKVVRGYMGVAPENISPAMAKALGITDVRGVLVGDVVAGGPAAQAGLQRGDVVKEINGERLEDMNQFRLKVSMLAPGTTVTLKIVRDGQEKTMPVKLIEYPNETAQNRTRDDSSAGATALDGVAVDELDPQTLRQLGLPSSTRGVVVTGVGDGSPASMADLQQGDVIQEIDHARISSVADYQRAVGRAIGHTMLLLVNRQGNTRFLAVEPR
jgi:serine protease Do